MDDRAYYKSYDDRYRQVHGENLQWFSSDPSPIVSEIIRDFSVRKIDEILEIGCGEGRDAGYLLEQGYHVLATDVSDEAIAYCRNSFPSYEDRFAVLDCLGERLDKRFDFIYAIAVIHMLVPDQDRDGFYRFICEHLKDDGIALIGTMGDGRRELQSDITTAFHLQEREHAASGKTMMLAGTSCRMVSLETFQSEIRRNGLEVVRYGSTAVEPDFPQMIYAVVKRG